MIKYREIVHLIQIKYRYSPLADADVWWGLLKGWLVGKGETRPNRSLISLRAGGARRMRHKIGVIGSAEFEGVKVAAKAREVGKQIAINGCILLTGSSSGLSYEAARGAKESGGFTVGVSPASSLREHTGTYGLPTECFDLLVFTGFGFKGRNVVLVRSCDALVVVAGRMGTLNEFTIAYDEGRLIGVLSTSGGISGYLKTIVRKSAKKGPRIAYHADPAILVGQLVEALAERRAAHRTP